MERHPTTIPQPGIWRAQSPFDFLTPREAEVLGDIIDGRSADDISRESGVAISTVRSQIKSILQKLGVGSQIAAVALARRSHWNPRGHAWGDGFGQDAGGGSNGRSSARPQAQPLTSHAVVRPINPNSKRVLLIDAETRPTADVNCSKWILEEIHHRGLRVKAITVTASTTDPNVPCSHEDVVLLLLDRATTLPPRGGEADPWQRWEQLTAHLAQQGALVVLVAAETPLAAIALCLKAGARGFIAVNEAEDLLDVIVSAGAKFDAACVNQPPLTASPAIAQQLERLTRLTIDQFRVLFQMVKGYPTSRIAAELRRPVATIEALIDSIMRTLDVETELAAVALANGSAGLGV